MKDDNICTSCNGTIHQDNHGVWVDQTGGDDCPLYKEGNGQGPHIPIRLHRKYLVNNSKAHK